MQQAGFAVRTHDIDDVPAARQRLGMLARRGSRHSAKMAGDVVEGHVPAVDIQHPLKESPKPVPDNTRLVQTGGETSIFAKH